MTLAQPEKRLETIEKLIADQSKWWLEHAGAFANDPGYEQIVDLWTEVPPISET